VLLLLLISGSINEDRWWTLLSVDIWRVYTDSCQQLMLVLDVGKLTPAFPSAAECSALHMVPVSTCPEFLHPAVTVPSPM